MEPMIYFLRVLVAFSRLLALFCNSFDHRKNDNHPFYSLYYARMTSWTVSCVGDHNGNLGGILQYPGLPCITKVFKHRSEV
ncbi:hypothetical protein BDR03DRAFT_954728 [Suillus americanus]|nr:hypothetical protein BDR03DRAFT_954728 [Suillus americanus]